MRRSLTLIFFVLIPVVAHGATYYVAKTGSNSNTCAQSQTLTTARQTIAAGLACLAAGDTLTIKAGTYTEGISIGAIPSGLNDSSRTIVQGAANETVILNGTGSNGDVIEISGRQYITVNNLTLTGAPYMGVRIGEGGGLESSYITLTNLIIYGNGTAGHDGHGIYTGGTGGQNHHILMQRLKIYHNGFPYLGGNHGHNVYITGSDCILEDSEIYDAESHGVHVYGATVFSSTSRNIIRRNRIHDNGSFGIMLSSGSDNLAYNNVVYGNSVTYTGSGGIRTYDGCSNCQIYNNTVYNNKNNGIWVQSGNAGVVKNNISYRNSSSDYVDNAASTTQSFNLFGSDPSFSSVSSSDFHLKTGSAALDRGTSLSSVFTTDFDGNDRPTGTAYDIGAFEYGTSNLTPPKNVRVMSIK